MHVKWKIFDWYVKITIFYHFLLFQLLLSSLFAFLKMALWFHFSENGLIRDVKNLSDLSINEDYYEPIKNNDAFNSNYIEYERNGDKNKTISIKEHFNMIRAYLRDIINDHKTQGEWKVHSGNEVINHKPQGKWKIQ